MELHDGMKILVSSLTSKPRRHCTVDVKELGAIWHADIEFTVDGPISEGGIEVREVRFCGVVVEFELLSMAAQDEILWACEESL